MSGLFTPVSGGDGKRNPKGHSFPSLKDRSERSEESPQKDPYFCAVFFCVRMTDKIGKAYEIWRNEEAITRDL